jgi:D-galactarate dehydratase / Altronate hydrolase, C terminus
MSRPYAFGVDVKPAPNFDLPATFDGIRRPDGWVATRNYIGILTSVNCSAHVASLKSSILRVRMASADGWAHRVDKPHGLPDGKKGMARSYALTGCVNCEPSELGS